MGNNTPRCQCDRCLRWFLNRNDLRRHREAKGHQTLLLRQSRYNRICINGDNDAKASLYDFYRAG
jgi:hypothetical protein